MTNRDKAINSAHKTANAISTNYKGRDIIPGLSVQLKDTNPKQAVELYMTANGLSLKKSIELARIMFKYKNDPGKLKAQVNRVLNMKFFPDAVMGEADVVAKADYTKQVKHPKQKANNIPEPINNTIEL